jgi:hypothetical protein
VTDHLGRILFDIAYGIAEGRVDYSGLSVPTTLHAAVADATGLSSETALTCAAIVLRAMAVQKAVVSRLQDDGDGFNDC